MDRGEEEAVEEVSHVEQPAKAKEASSEETEEYLENARSEEHTSELQSH